MFCEVVQFLEVAEHVGSSSCRRPEYHLLGPECRRVWAVPERGAAEQDMRPAGQHANLHLGSLGDHQRGDVGLQGKCSAHMARPVTVARPIYMIRHDIFTSS